MRSRIASEMRRRTDARMVTADFSKSPFTLAWEITRACALACMHCRAEAQPKPDPNELSHDEAIGVLDQIRDMGNPILVVTGGGPPLRPAVSALLTYAAVEKGLRTSLTPSATALVTPKNLAKVHDAGVVRVAVSLDGPAADVHDRFRGFRGAVDRTRRAMRDVTEAGIALQINTTVSRFNLPVLEQMPAIVSESGAVQWSVFFLVPTGRGKLGDMVTAEEHEQVFNWLYDLSREAPFDVKSTAAPAYRRGGRRRGGGGGGGGGRRGGPGAAARGGG